MYDAIVIGVGGMGSATLWHLARSNCKVLGLERFDIPNRFGSSHGSTRIIRLAYSEGPGYIPLLQAAYRYWEEIEQVSGTSILHKTGGLDIGHEDSWTVRGSLESCREHQIAFGELDAMEVNRRFPGYRLPTSMAAVYQRDGGYLLSERAIATFADAARENGAEIHTNEPVQHWERGSSALRVETAIGEYRTKRLVITAGPWIGKLCPALNSMCKPQRQVMLWTQPTSPKAFTPNRFPVFNMEAPLGRFYGFPDHEGEGFKIGKYYHRLQAVDNPDGLDRECHPEDETILREGIEEYFPLANGATRRMAACMFTNTHDKDFILDRAPGENNVFVAGGFSGHGFKFCSAIGKVMADFCLHRASAWDIQRFSLGKVRDSYR